MKNFLPLTPLCANEQDILALGAIFATTDSVAVLQVLDQERSPILFSLVFGEGVLNDAAGVALLRAIQVCCCCALFMSGMWETDFGIQSMDNQAYFAALETQDANQ